MGIVIRHILINIVFITDTTLLSRSRSVGSVEVAGVGTSMLQSNSANHQQSSLSLNDMEQLEEAHLNGMVKFTVLLRMRPTTVSHK
jgi:hypothetical protein